MVETLVRDLCFEIFQVFVLEKYRLFIFIRSKYNSVNI